MDWCWVPIGLLLLDVLCIIAILLDELIYTVRLKRKIRWYYQYEWSRLKKQEPEFEATFKPVHARFNPEVTDKPTKIIIRRIK